MPELIPAAPGSPCDDHGPLDMCEHCAYPLAEHIGRKPCTVSPPSTAKTIYDLPIMAWAWKEDGRDRRA